MPAAMSSAPPAMRSGETWLPRTVIAELPGSRSLSRLQRCRSTGSVRAQIRAEPAAASATGQATASANQIPAPRRNSMLPATMQATAAIWRLRGRLRTGVGGAEASGSLLTAHSTR